MAVQCAQAADFTYNDLNGVDVMFFDISEHTTTAEPLFGQPVVVGNTMDFDPTNFVSESGSGESSIVDSQLSFKVMTVNPIDSILTVRFSERGDYALAGLGDAVALASVTAHVFWDVLEINNQPVGTTISGNADLTFAPSGGQYSLANNGEGGDIWIGELNLDVPAGTTKVGFTMDNALLTAAANGGSASIRKKDGDIKIEILIPEPTSMTLGLMGLLGVVMATRRRRMA
jgi:hypothetical protein